MFSYAYFYGWTHAFILICVFLGRTGSRVKVNEQEVALFRYGDIVYAISEQCPHAGMYVGYFTTTSKYVMKGQVCR